MEIGLLTSSGFDKDNYPLIIDACNRKGLKVHEYRNLDSTQLENVEEIIHMDAIWDRSSITDDIFFRKLSDILNLNSSNALLINSPISTMNSYNKIRMHKLLGKYSPQTIIYDGTNLDEVLEKFDGDERLVFKDPLGWQGKGVDIITRENLESNLKDNQNILVQRYVPSLNGIGRVLCVNTPHDFSILGAYTRYPTKSWKTGPGSEPIITRSEITDQLYNFARNVTSESGLFINGIDYIEHENRLYLLEVNSVPRLYTLHKHFGIDVAGVVIDHIMKAKNR